MRSLYLAAIVGLLASGLEAQRPPRAYAVSGIVYDSVAGEPLVGAVVQIVFPDSVVRSFSAITDSAGRYRLTGLPHGLAAIGFQHSSLAALGIESPIRGIELDRDISITVDLAIPSGNVVRAERCAAAKDPTDGMIAGFVTDGAREGLVPGAVVEVEWLELVRKGKIFGSAPHRARATVADDGTYLACGIPGDAFVSIGVTRPGYHFVEGHVAVPAGGATRLDFRLADSTVTHGTAALVGRVLRNDRTPLPSGQLLIPALGMETKVTNGTFSLGGLPGGTWNVEARAIGYEPHSQFVQLAEQDVTTTVIAITKTAQVLEAVSIIGRPDRDLKIMDAVLARARVNDGTTFLPGNEFMQSALYAADVLVAAKGFSYRSPTSVSARGCLIASSGKSVAVYLDGSRVPSGLEGLNNFIAMRQVLAIEAYPDVVSAPFLWRTMDACAVIAVWTKR